ncbi:hypothetical protein ACFCYX_04200 [Streptomyces populi]|uniref:hypothetical protein n=1 Tax=Streptomyces populi TaxID=2058924 RepID=UPI00142E54F5|nr:hypothetical protein [Streptomyces populi]
MAVFALLVPVFLMLMMFALDAFEDLLFPPPVPPPDEPEELDGPFADEVDRENAGR